MKWFPPIPNPSPSPPVTSTVSSWLASLRPVATASAADGDHVMCRDLQLDQGLLKGREHAEVAAAGAPVGIDLAFQFGNGKLSGTLYAGCHRSLLLRP